MNKCLNCGKEIPEGRKFCCSSCSAKYNNIRRQRRPWTEEQHKKNRKQTVCKYCGKPGSTVCCDCKPFVKFVPSLKKLGWVEGKSLKQGKEEAEKLLKTLYFEDRESLLTLAKRFNLSKDTVKSYIGTVRTLSEANRTSVESGRHRLYGDPKFKSGTHISWEGKKFHFRSSWEEEYMEQLDGKKVSYLYEPFSIRYFDTQRGKERVAIPDFFIPDTNTIVELKSSYTYDEQNMKDKFLAYKSRGFKTQLLLDWKEIVL